MTLARGEREWNLLISEYNICKKKLESKRQALKILMGDLESCQRERDIYKNKIKQLQQEVDNYKKQEREREMKALRGGRSPMSPRSPEHHKSLKRERRLSGNSIWEQELQNVRDRKNKTLSQLLCESREENKALVNDFNDLRGLYKEAQEDILLLRENLARQRSSFKGQGTSEDLEARQNLIKELEQSREKEQQLERDLQAVHDEKGEVAVERDHYREKSNRLNTQLNFILGADEQRLVDIDAVLMENRYQREHIKQLKEEKSMASAALNRYKAAFEKKKNRLLQAGYGQPGNHTGVHGAKQVFPAILSELTHSFGGGGVSTNTASELQFLANSLSESLSEKDIALLHQKNTNRILGNRVAELEKKLKTLEVSGLWSLEGHRGYGSDGMGTMKLRRSPRTSNADVNQNSTPHREANQSDSSPIHDPEDPVFLFKDQENHGINDACLVDVNSEDFNLTLSDEDCDIEGASFGAFSSMEEHSISVSSKITSSTEDETEDSGQGECERDFTPERIPPKKPNQVNSNVPNDEDFSSHTDSNDHVTSDTQNDADFSSNTESSDRLNPDTQNDFSPERTASPLDTTENSPCPTVSDRLEVNNGLTSCNDESEYYHCTDVNGNGTLQQE
ncbi:coiled-coil domain-containing protein 149-A isoform X1 [Nematostella vectensis]|uniref:coiled-coil domain-containing protein 149-A isoform X1 n=2 Tax=Nematostella vectensis TaxID=45351 RepID=UPI0020771A3C|nr:coiled-coil domain-containing protein 149-A isoform X1 [Nematostella vectensis]